MRMYVERWLLIEVERYTSDLGLEAASHRAREVFRLQGSIDFRQDNRFTCTRDNRFNHGTEPISMLIPRETLAHKKGIVGGVFSK